jgi:hypothetical protein
MTESEISDYEATVGDWTVSVVSQYLSGDVPSYVDYYDVVEQTGITEAVPIFVGALPYFRMPVALTSDDDGSIDRLIPLYPALVSWEDMGRDADASFDYAEIKEYINSHPQEFDPDRTGGFGSVVSDQGTSDIGLKTRTILISIVAILIACCGLTFVTLRYRKVKRGSTETK